MKIVLDDIFVDELKDYLIDQPGINDVEVITKNLISEINVNSKIDPLVVLQYIELFQKNNNSTMLSFDKGNIFESNHLKYLVDDMCCEYCYKSLIKELFKNEYIKSVESNFDFYKPAFNIELLIEYDKNYSRKELINYILENK